MSSRDGNKFLTYVLIVGSIVGVYLLIKIAPGYIRDFQIQHTVETAAGFYRDEGKRDTVPVYLEKKIVEMELPIPLEDFKIEDDGDTVRIYVDWQKEVVFIPDNRFIPAKKKVYKFHNEAIEKLKR